MPKKKKVSLPTITQLPSGSYHAQVLDYIDADGKRVIRSFTDPDIAVVVREVTQFKLEREARKKTQPRARRTVRQAMTDYVDARVPVLSPTTITAYRKIIKCQLQSIMDTDIYDLTQEAIQSAVSEDARTHTPKTLRNSTGLLSASLRAARPDFAYHVSLPLPRKQEVPIPTEQEIVNLLAAVRDTDMELPITFAALCGMRLSEVCALRWSDITVNPDQSSATIRIRRSLVHIPPPQIRDAKPEAIHSVARPHSDTGESGAWIEKANKTTSSSRDLPVGETVTRILLRWMQRPTGGGEYICISPYLVDRRYRQLRKQYLNDKITFHDLRHYCASVMVASGAPLNYVSAYLGHSTDHTTRAIYLHTMTAEQDRISALLNDHLKATFNT